MRVTAGRLYGPPEREMRRVGEAGPSTQVPQAPGRERTRVFPSEAP